MDYTGYTVTEESGFGPYFFSAATGLRDGQDASTQRFPNVGDPVTYTATIRNRGTTRYIASIHPTWRLDGTVVSMPTVFVDLNPGDQATVDDVLPWDNQSHDLGLC